MIRLYDKAIVEDLKKSFNYSDGSEPVVKVIDPEQIIGLAAQIQNDAVKFPIVALSRKDYQIDTNRTNFTRAHMGVASVIDKKTNNLYYEKVIPITLAYDMTVLTTNQIDMDELIREILFKYTAMYFLTIKLPYECDRKVRFGVVVEPGADIEKSSGSTEYLASGSLYQSIIPLKCEGAVLVSYTPAHLRRDVLQVEAE